MSVVDVLIATALEMERNAVRDAAAWREDIRTGVRYWEPKDADNFPDCLLGEYALADGGSLTIALAHPTRMGSNFTSNIVSTLVERLKPRCLAMCGVCAGNPSDVALGDVVIANPVFQYDEGKRTVAGFEGDLFPTPMDMRWVRRANELRTDGLPSYGAPSEADATLWLLERFSAGANPAKHPAYARYFPSGAGPERIRQLEGEGWLRRQRREFVITKAGREFLDRDLAYKIDAPAQLPFAIKVGPMASGNAVVKDGLTWDMLKGLGQRSAIALEMEAASIGVTGYTRSLSKWIVVKGVMDHADPNKDDRYKPFAARASAEVLLRFLEQNAGSVRDDHSQSQMTAKLPALSLPSENDSVTGLSDMATDLQRFVGRQEHIGLLVTALTAGPTPFAGLILGGPGIGKTALTIKIAESAKAVECFRNRRWFISLETALDADGFDRAVIAGVGLDPARCSFENALAYLDRRPSLLVLDNLETPWWVDSRAIEQRLSRLAEIRTTAILASLRGDQTVDGVRWSHEVELSALTMAESRELFLDIARRVSPQDSRLDPFLGELGGIPLAIRLIALQAGKQLDELWEEWLNSGVALATKLGTEQNRLSSVDKSIKLSIQSRRLNEGGRQLFGLLGQLPAGINTEDRRNILGIGSGDFARRLRSTGLAYQRGRRLDLLPPVRDYARRNYEPETADQTLWQRYYVELAAGPSDLSGVDGPRRINRLVPEIANIVSAARGLKGGEGASGLTQAMTVLSRVMIESGVGSHIALRDLADDHKTRGDFRGEAYLRTLLGELAYVRSDYELALLSFSAARSIYRTYGETANEAHCVRRLGHFAFDAADYKNAREHYKKALGLFEEAIDNSGQADCILSLGRIALQETNYGEARADIEKAKQLFGCCGQMDAEVYCTEKLADIAWRVGEYEAACKSYKEALSYYRKKGFNSDKARCLYALGDASLGLKDLDFARQCYDKARHIFARIGDELMEANCLVRISGMDTELLNYQTASNTLNEALRLYESSGSKHGKANCLWSLGEVSKKNEKWSEAESLFEQAQHLFDLIGDKLGSANSLKSRGDISLSRSDRHSARRFYEAALTLYSQIPQPEGIALMNRLLMLTSGKEASATTAPN
jgi:tetratricopeptide (TPR) repeat protein/nucleoside phosphorylase